MIEISRITKTGPVLSRGDLTGSFNRTAPAFSRSTVRNINLGKQVSPAAPADPPRRSAAPGAPRGPQPPVQPAAPAMPPALKMPRPQHPVQRGQKTPLGIREGSGARLRIAVGWNVRDARCDIDASAFLLTPENRVPSDEWFVFYGQPASPDGSVRFREDGQTDREVITVDLAKLAPQIQRIVFVMTINEAFENRLNFGMIEDAWLRILDESGQEIVSYCPGDLNERVTSMTLGEIYLRSGEWRFNPVGNGVNADLAGQCAVYGVTISDQEDN